MDYELRKKLYELDEIGFVGTQNVKETEKDKTIINYLIKASRRMWKKEGIGLTEEEKNKVIQEAERVYNQEVRQRKKMMTFDKVASVTL